MRLPGPWLAIVGLGLLLGQVPAQAADLPDPAGLADGMARACRQLQPAEGSQPPAGGLQDLELYLAALGHAALGEDEAASALYQYLIDYYERSPLVSLVPALPPDSAWLSEYNPGPAYSRLVRSFYNAFTISPGPGHPEQLGEALVCQLHATQEQDWRDCLQRHPDSAYAVWFAYQAAWQQAVEAHSVEPLIAFGRDHPGHPLGQEARQAVDLRFFSPARMARLSALLPGLGEETLEPGLRESSGVMYSELVYVLGTVGFAIAAQYGSRTENLTSALLLANLLMLNHRGSAEHAYLLASRRNQAEARKFMQARLGSPVQGPGPARLPEPGPADSSAMASDLWLALELPLADGLTGLAGRGWVAEEQLANLGLRAHYGIRVLELFQTPVWQSSLAAGPWGRYYANRAQRRDEAALAADARLWELAAGLEAVFLARYDFGGGWLQLRLAAGPGWRLQQADAGSGRSSDAGWIGAAAASLEVGGPSGTFWQVGYAWEESGRIRGLETAWETVFVPGQRQAVNFGLGIHF